jgi:hypothetical protein
MSQSASLPAEQMFQFAGKVRLCGIPLGDRHPPPAYQGRDTRSPAAPTVRPRRQRPRRCRTAEPRDGLTPPHPPSPEIVLWIAYRGRGRMWALRPIFFCSAGGGFCDGFRMPANAYLSTGTRAGVRKPPKNETAGSRAPGGSAGANGELVGTVVGACARRCCTGSGCKRDTQIEAGPDAARNSITAQSC